MANIKIPDLPLAVSLTGTEEMEIVQPPGSGGTSKRTTTQAVANLAGAAPVVAEYLLASSSATLTQSRTLTVSAALSLVDGGPGGPFTIGTKAITGDVAIAADGTVSTLSNTAVVAGTYALATFTVNAQGRITAAEDGMTDFNLAEIDGNPVETGNGTAADSLRVTIANDSDGVVALVDASGNPLTYEEPVGVEEELLPVSGLSAAVIAVSSGTTTQVVAAVSGQTTRVYRLRLNVAGANVVTVKRGSTTLEVLNFTAATPVPFMYPLSGRAYYTTAANEALNVETSTSAALNAVFEYVTSA